MKIECDVCEKAPATVICGADEAALCGECDGEVHAANKLASRHQRHLLDLLPNELPPSDICQVHPPHNISPNLFRDVQQQSTNQMGAKNAWRVKEDVALMSSWCFVSGERKRGKNQKGSLWAQVHKMYTIARDENPEDLRERNVDSMKGRWKRISDNANKWIAAYRKAHSRRTSEMSQNDIEKEAHTIFEADGASKFQDLFVFNEVMSKNEKWDLKLDYGSIHDENGVDDEESGGSSKRLRTGEDVDNSTPSNPLTLDSGCSTIPCPIGRDMTKRSGKGKVKTSLFPANIEVAETCAMKLTGESEVEVMNKLERDRIELENKKEQRKIMKINSNLLMSLLAKNNLSPAEEDMKRHLMVVLTKQSM